MPISLPPLLPPSLPPPPPLFLIFLPSLCSLPAPHPIHPSGHFNHMLWLLPSWLLYLVERGRLLIIDVVAISHTLIDDDSQLQRSMPGWSRAGRPTFSQDPQQRERQSQLCWKTLAALADYKIPFVWSDAEFEFPGKPHSCL